ncbi:MAG: hypothetical protein LBO09_08170 [Candidatus Peribacteria bacterium]|jgi:hypothetical protein|nr:hypothetical protein [Candidatus Peribacteria bacterium]
MTRIRIKDLKVGDVISLNVSSVGLSLLAPQLDFVPKRFVPEKEFSEETYLNELRKQYTDSILQVIDSKYQVSKESILKFLTQNVKASTKEPFCVHQTDEFVVTVACEITVGKRTEKAVHAQRLKEGNYDPKGIQISLDTEFTEVALLRAMKMTFK